MSSQCQSGAQARPTIEVVAALIYQAGRLLATQRGYGEWAGGWEFPGGKMEANETPQAALIREIQEELNVTIEPQARLVTVEYDYPTFHLTMHCYWARVVDGSLHLNEHQAMQWLTPSSLRTLSWLPADVAVVDAIERSDFQWY